MGPGIKVASLALRECRRRGAPPQVAPPGFGHVVRHGISFAFEPAG